MNDISEYFIFVLLLIGFGAGFVCGGIFGLSMFEKSKKDEK